MRHGRLPGAAAACNSDAGQQAKIGATADQSKALHGASAKDLVRHDEVTQSTMLQCKPPAGPVKRRSTNCPKLMRCSAKSNANYSMKYKLLCLVAPAVFEHW